MQRKTADISNNTIIKIEADAIHNPAMDTASKIAEGFAVLLDVLMK